MICKKCGADIEDNSRFCTYCGAVVDRIELVPDEEPSDGNPAEVRIEANNEKPVKTKNNKFLIGVLASCGAVIIAVLLAVVLFLVGTKDMRSALKNNDPVAVCNIYIEAEKEHDNIKVSEYDWLITIKIKSIIKVFNEYDYETAIVEKGDKTVDNLIYSFGVFIYGQGGSSSPIEVVLSDENLDRWNELKEIIKSKKDLCEEILLNGTISDKNKNNTLDDSSTTLTTTTSTATTTTTQSTRQPANSSEKLSLEEMLTIGYWRSEDYGDVIFRPIKNSEVFDGIMVGDGWTNVLPYKLDEYGNVMVCTWNYEYNESSNDYDCIYDKIKKIDSNRDGSRSFSVETAEGCISFKNIIISNADLLLKFSVWGDFDCGTKTVDEFLDHRFLYLITEEAQRDVHFYFFDNYEDREEREGSYNLCISTDELGNEHWGADSSVYDNYTIDVKKHCVYIGENKYEINKDFSQLYCKETGHTIYRITDFALGKIADTDFPPGKLVVD